MAPLSRIFAVVLAMTVLVGSPLDVDTAKRRTPRFKIVERTHHSESYFSLPGLALATHYPDVIEVRGPTDAKIIDIDLMLFELAHGAPRDLDVLLVGPNGRSALVMADAGGDAGVLGIDLTLDDDATRSLPENQALSSGRYRPANYADGAAASETIPGSGLPGGDGAPGGDGEPGGDGQPGGYDEGGGDEFPAPAPAPGEGRTLSTFRGIEPSGEWQLFIRADGPAAGSLSGGWGLRITTKKPR